MVTIRAYSEADLRACRSLWLELTQHHRDLYGDQSIGGPTPELEFDEHIKRADLVAMWLATEDDAVVGMIGLLLNGDEAQIEPIVVTRGRRSNGIGDALLRHARAEAIARNAHFLSLAPVARNTRAVRKFMASGFNIVGHVDLFEDLRPGERTWLPDFDPGAPLRY